MMDLQKQESFKTILTLIQDSRNHVFATVNRTLVELYWRVGEYVSKKVDKEVWGKSTVQDLSLFTQREHPEIKGFTASNIWRMKFFYEAYAENQKLASLWRELAWTHNRTIFSRCKTDEERVFYPHFITKNRLSVMMLSQVK